MAGFFSRLFGSSKPEEEADALTPELAAATLLVEAALTDGVYAEVESVAIRTVLQDAFGLSEDDARALRDRAEDEAENAIDAHRFTTQVKKLDEAQRLKVIEGLYLVAQADGDPCKFEDAFIRHIGSLLHIEDVARNQARQRAQAANLSSDDNTTA